MESGAARAAKRTAPRATARRATSTTLAGEVTSLVFAQISGQITTAAEAEGLVAPSLRSPPRVAGVHRTIRQRRDGTAVVAVARRGRSLPAVAADIIDGVVVANALDAHAASRARDAMWRSIAVEVAAAATDAA